MTEVRYVDREGVFAGADALLAVVAEGRESAGASEAFAAAGIDPESAASGALGIKAGSARCFWGAKGRPAVIAGGAGASPDAGALFRAAGAGMVLAREYGLARVGLALPDFEAASGSRRETVRELVAGALAGLYRYQEFKSDPQDEKVAQLLVAAENDDEAAGAREGEAAAAGLALARDLVNGPPNSVTPARVAEAARELAKRHGFDVRVMDGREARDAGMGLFASVFASDPGAARLVVVSNQRAGTDQPPLAVVGKGVTFDSGGLSLKPAGSMDAMKTDMAGAAAVLGLFEALGRLDGAVPVVGIMPLTENMPGPAATRPGDVVRALTGKTVEIVNTDAEGRLLLADALAYAGRYSPEVVVDVATLTGACVVALGKEVAGLFSPDDELAAAILAAGERTGERLWRMPLFDLYREELESDVADMKNCGSREGGACHAAVFLQSFVPEGARWAHLDIAGPARREGKGGLKGGTGFGVRTLLELVLARTRDAG